MRLAELRQELPEPSSRSSRPSPEARHSSWTSCFLCADVNQVLKINVISFNQSTYVESKFKNKGYIFVIVTNLYFIWNNFETCCPQFWLWGRPTKKNPTIWTLGQQSEQTWHSRPIYTASKENATDKEEFLVVIDNWGQALGFQLTFRTASPRWTVGNTHRQVNF